MSSVTPRAGDGESLTMRLGALYSALDRLSPEPTFSPAALFRYRSHCHFMGPSAELVATDKAKEVVRWVSSALAHGVDHPGTIDIIDRLHGVLHGGDLSSMPAIRLRAKRLIDEHAIKFGAAQRLEDRSAILDALAQHLALGVDRKLLPLLNDPSLLAQLLERHTTHHAREKLTTAAIMAKLGVKYGAFGGVLGSRNEENLRKNIEDSLRRSTTTE